MSSLDPEYISEIKAEVSRLWKRSESETSGRELVRSIIGYLDTGQIRVAEQVDGYWQVNEWVKKSILLYFRHRVSRTIEHGPFEYCDKIPLKKKFHETDVRVVPPASVRFGSYLGERTVINPSYINIGVYIGHKTKIDSFVSVGACAQIGHHVHIGNSVGIGSMLEPVQACPCIVEDYVHISPRCEIMEGVVIGSGAVLGMGCYIGSGTMIYDLDRGTLLPRGHVPAWSICVPGSVPSADGTHSTYAVLVKGRRPEDMDARRALNEVLRDDRLHR